MLIAALFTHYCSSLIRRFCCFLLRSSLLYQEDRARISLRVFPFYLIHGITRVCLTISLVLNCMPRGLVYQHRLFRSCLLTMKMCSVAFVLFLVVLASAIDKELYGKYEQNECLCLFKIDLKIQKKLCLKNISRRSVELRFPPLLVWVFWEKGKVSLDFCLDLFLS